MKEPKLPWPFDRREPEESDELEGEPAPLEPIRILTRESEIDGFIVPSGERVTDILTRGQDLSILPTGAPNEPGRWLLVSPHEVQLVIPPPHVSVPERRLVRQPRDVFVRVGSSELRGTAHLVPGAEHDIAGRSAHPFLPLTDVAWLRAGAPEPEHYDVVIVNLRETSDFRVL